VGGAGAGGAGGSVGLRFGAGERVAGRLRRLYVCGSVRTDSSMGARGSEGGSTSIASGSSSRIGGAAGTNGDRCPLRVGGERGFERGVRGERTLRGTVGGVCGVEEDEEGVASRELRRSAGGMGGDVAVGGSCAFGGLTTL
jgi:hypothetical protein